jgi:predicted Rossmann fold nucleotide-binding protein DprA/Smf involved in DNA uptake
MECSDALEPFRAVERALLAIMGRRGGWHPDALCDASGLPVQQVLTALTRLELSGRVSASWGLFAPP